MVAGILQFRPQPLDMGINGAGKNSVAVIPDILQKILTGFDLPDRFEQRGQKLKLRERELNQLTLYRHFMLKEMK